MEQQRGSLPERGKEKSGKDAGRAEREDSGVLLQELSLIAVLSRERTCRKTCFCCHLEVFSVAVESLHSRGDELSNGQHILEAQKKDPSHDKVAKGATHGCGSTFHLLEDKKNRVLDLNAVGFEAQHLSKEEVCAKGEKNSAKLSVKEGLVQHGGCEGH